MGAVLEFVFWVMAIGAVVVIAGIPVLAYFADRYPVYGWLSDYSSKPSKGSSSSNSSSTDTSFSSFDAGSSSCDSGSSSGSDCSF